jgi:hypothetical protein
LDLDKVRRADIADKDGKIYKCFGKIVPKDEYYFILYKLAEYIIQSAKIDASMHKVQQFMQTMQDYELEPLKETAFTFKLDLQNDEIRKIVAYAEFCNQAEQPADSKYRAEFELGVKLGKGELKIQ